MKAPYLLMTGLYLLLTGLITLDSSLASIGWAPALAGLKWMRVHFLTLGVLTQVVFGLLPVLTAKGLNQPKPRMNWFSWLLYNAGLVILLIGLPMVHAPTIITGGTLIFIAVLSLMNDLFGLRRTALADRGRSVCSSYSTTRFYLAGLVYLLVGVLVGTGMWIGWAEPLHIAIPKEVHVHTNLWGYTALLFAGLIFDLFPGLTQQRLLGKVRLDMLVFALMAVGAAGLVIGPWLDIGWPAVVGLTLHTIGTLILLAQMIRMVVRERWQRHPGVVHMVTAYIWLLVPVVVAPFIVAKASEHFPVAEVSGNGGPILIYGWILTFILAIIPYILSQALHPNRAARLGGNWFSLITMHAGSLLFWSSLFFQPLQNALRAGAFLAWFAALLPMMLNLYSLTRSEVERTEQTAQKSLVREHTNMD